jgi:DNA-directed RNA polymerase subunit RPC12/RpoP
MNNMKQKPIECKYKCEKCDYEFTQPTPGPMSCKRCGHTYVKWLNSKEYMLTKEEWVK